VIRTTLGRDGALDLRGAGAVVCAQHDKDTIHGSTLLTKPMTEGQSTSFNLTIVSFLAYASRNFRLYVTGFIGLAIGGAGFFGPGDLR
jgi:hypothetical protein